MIECVNEKIKVFVSSICGKDKYDNVRLKLKELLEDTGFIKVYLFEKGIASTMTAQQDYLYNLDDSDVCIFLIDNKDGVTAAVQTEIKRAKDFPKKSIYLFCSEESDNVTQVQQDLYGANGCRFLEVNKFDEFADVGLKSLVNDITRIYQSYCKNRIVDQEFAEDEEEHQYSYEDGSNDIPYKEILKSLDKCTNYFKKMLNFYCKDEDVKTSKLDDYLSRFLKVIFDGKLIDDFNAFLFLETIKEFQDEKFHAVVKKRWNAIQKYWSEDLERCYTELEEALKLAKELELPEWVIQDILIDLRNVLNYIDKSNNQVRIDNKIQEELTAQQRHVYYPTLDRYEKSLYEYINVEREKYIKRPANTKVIGNSFGGYIDNVVNIYCVAAMNGSLTHLEILPRRLKHILFNVCIEFESIPNIKELLKMTLYNGTLKEVKELATTFNGVYSKINATDVKELYEFCDVMPLNFRRKIAKLNVLKVFGYYFSDVQYNEILTSEFVEMHEWVSESDKLVALGDQYIEMLKNNNRRVDVNQTVLFSLGILENKFYRFSDKIFELLIRIEWSSVRVDLIKRTVKVINDFFVDKELYSKTHRLNSLVIFLRRNYENQFGEIDSIISKYNNAFYNGIYKLETSNKEEVSEEFIKTRINQIKVRNVQQGKNGTIIGYGENPFSTIRNIYQNRAETSLKELDEICDVCYETIVSEDQSFSEKLSAIELILFMSNMSGNQIELLRSYNAKLKENSSSIYMSCDTLFGDVSEVSVRFGIELIDVIVTNKTEIDFLLLLASIPSYSDSEKMDILNLLENMYINRENVLNEKLNMLLEMYVIGLLNENSHDVRYHAFDTLIAMFNKEKSVTILSVLSSKFDEESSFIKSLILNNYDDLFSDNPNIGEVLLIKASVDNNYVVREMANKIRTTFGEVK